MIDFIVDRSAFAENSCFIWLCRRRAGLLHQLAHLRFCLGRIARLRLLSEHSKIEN
jgi:hypothetical protein